jgi:hypothetical protein
MLFKEIISLYSKNHTKHKTQRYGFLKHMSYVFTLGFKELRRVCITRFVPYFQKPPVSWNVQK